MQYVIKPKVKKSKVLYAAKDHDGLEVKPNSKVINIQKMVLTDPDLINEYIQTRLERKFKDIFTKLYEILSDPDTDEDGVARLLGEAEKLRQIIDVKYSKYLEGSKKREFITKIALIEEELKQKYLQIKYIEAMFNTNYYSYDESMSRGRGR